jgi:hypothetical protein
LAERTDLMREHADIARRLAPLVAARHKEVDAEAASQMTSK